MYLDVSGALFQHPGPLRCAESRASRGRGRLSRRPKASEAAEKGFGATFRGDSALFLRENRVESTKIA